MTLLHQRQQKQMSTIREPQEQRVNSVATMRKKIKSAEVCRELTTSDNKGDGAAAATQAHFVKVTGVLNEATHFSQP